MKCEQDVYDIPLKALELQLKYVPPHFNTIIFTHIYRELNEKVNKWSKDGVNKDQGALPIKESKDDICSKYRRDI